MSFLHFDLACYTASECGVNADCVEMQCKCNTGFGGDAAVMCNKRKYYIDLFMIYN